MEIIKLRIMVALTLMNRMKRTTIMMMRTRMTMMKKMIW
jgi:hypothetical protein